KVEDGRVGEGFGRIKDGSDEFRAASLKPRGFVAPAWLLSSQGERAARDAEMEYTTRLRTVRDLRSGETFHARSLVYSVRNGWRRGTSVMWNAALVRIGQNTPLMRLSIHPPDFSHPAIWGQIVSLITEMSAGMTATTYRNLIAAQRLNRVL